MNQDERRRLRRLMGDGLWTRLGKKKCEVQTIPRKQRLYDAVTTQKTFAPAGDRKKERKKKTCEEMRSRESPENFFENEACVLFQGSKTSDQFCE